MLVKALVFSRFLTPQTAPKTTQDQPKTAPRVFFFKSKISFDFVSFWCRFEGHFGVPRPSLWAPFSAPKTRMHAHTHACMHACVRVCVCASRVCVCACVRRIAQDGPKRPRDAPRGSQEVPKRPSGPPKRPSGRPQDVPEDHFGFENLAFA